MKRFLLPEAGNFYKANLHCHSTCSDGKCTPEELKEIYMQHGYSIIAYTDHDIMLPHFDLQDEHFLPLLGYEMEVNADKDEDGMIRKSCHMCLIALEPDPTKKQVCWHRERYLFGNAVHYRDQAKFDENEPDYVRSHTSDCICDMMKKGRKNGFFVTYNHPVWSRETRDDYLGFDGMHAMEIYNHCSWKGGFDEINPSVYDDMILNGKMIYCIASDDNHGDTDMCGGWTMIKADKLDYRTVTKALEDGNFYASNGPEIHSLWVEDGVLHVTCSDAASIAFRMKWPCVRVARKDEPLCEASLPLQDTHGYVRVTVQDASGKCAYTNAYRVADLLK